eukprot:TRINITY_DN2906_c0_g1_i1.p1 TRINITY_DN2906_c0_g1~~TRINITY_DN2906_c0_g1_i1.p1  ORF type:complete len:237 (-),score=40.17 TRINITY_DN2906_c0_g1_i1:54-659(-)
MKEADSKTTKKGIDFSAIWSALKKQLKELLSTVSGWMWLWLYLTIVVSGAILFMVLVGMVPIADKQKKDDYIEINSQILNAIFSLMAVASHPLRLFALYLFFFNRASLAKNFYPYAMDLPGKTLLVLFFLNLNCFAQYPISYAMWAYHVNDRPPYIIPVFLPISFGATAVGGILAGLYLKRWKAAQKQEAEKHETERHEGP